MHRFTLLRSGPRRAASGAVAVVALLVAGSFPAAATTPQSWEATRSCPDVLVIGARGSGEARAVDGSDANRGLGPRAVAVLEALVDVLDRRGVTVAPISVDYPAIGVDEAARGLLDPGSDGYRSSVSRGVAALADLVAATRAACPGSVLVLAGYSQGAEVTRRALAGGEIPDGEDIAAVILIADPGFDPGDAAHGVGMRGTFESNRRGIRASAFSAPPAPWVASRTFSVCNRGDVVCQFGVGRLPIGLLGWRSGRAVHESYGRADLDPVMRADVWPLILERLDAERFPRIPV